MGKKGIRAVLLCGVLLLLCGCGKTEDNTAYRDVSAGNLAKAIQASVDGFADGTTEEFSADNSDYAGRCYDSDEILTLSGDFYYIGSAGANADEIAVAKSSDETKRSKIEEIFSERKERRITDFRGYDDEQAKKAENTEIVVYGDYVIYLCTDNRNAAKQAAEAYLSEEPDTERTDSEEENGPDENADEADEKSAFSEPETEEEREYAGNLPEDKDYGEAFEDGFNPELITAYRDNTPELLTDSADRMLYDICVEILGEPDSERISDIEMENKIYCELICRIEYDFGEYSLLGPETNSANPYGALIDGTAICEGDSRSFMLLCKMYGIECKTVSGKANPEREEHSWNLVRIDGIWYYTDPCWGDLGESVCRFCYLNTTEDYLLDHWHFWDTDDLPETATTTYAEAYHYSYQTYRCEYGMEEE